MNAMNNPVIDRMILAEALKRTLAHAGTARPAHPIRGAEHDAEAAFGPHYSPGEWFGELTGADLAACTIWEGVVYGHTDGAIDLLPPEGADAAAEILLPDLGSSIRMSAVWGMNKASVAPWDVFTLKGCAP